MNIRFSEAAGFSGACRFHNSKLAYVDALCTEDILPHFLAEKQANVLHFTVHKEEFLTYVFEVVVDMVLRPASIFSTACVNKRTKTFQNASASIIDLNGQKNFLCMFLKCQLIEFFVQPHFISTV